MCCFICFEGIYESSSLVWIMYYDMSWLYVQGRLSVRGGHICCLNLERKITVLWQIFAYMSIAVLGLLIKEKKVKLLT